MFNRYPYTNFHELNLDYFIQHFNEIFTEWEQLYNELTSWKTDTTEELAQWRADVEADLDEREAALRAELEIWKQDTADDISEWETATLNELDAWKTATTAQFEAIRVQAAASAEAAAAAQTAAETARTQAETAREAAETAAASVRASAAQIDTNTEDINDLKKRVTKTEQAVFDWYIAEGDAAISASQSGSTISRKDICVVSIEAGQPYTILITDPDDCITTNTQGNKIVTLYYADAGGNYHSTGNIYVGQPITRLAPENITRLAIYKSNGATGNTGNVHAVVDYRRSTSDGSLVYKVKGISDIAEDTRSGLEDIATKSLNLFDTENFTTGSYRNKSGNLNTNASYGYTDWIPVSSGDVLYYNCGAARLLCATDRFKIVNVSAGSDTQIASGAYTVPSGISYVSLSFLLSDIPEDAIISVNTLIDYKPYNSWELKPIPQISALEGEIDKAKIVLGADSVTLDVANLAADTLLKLEDAPWFIMKNQGISTRVKFSTFTSLAVGKGYLNYRGRWIIIDDTYVHIYSTKEDDTYPGDAVQYDYNAHSEYIKQNGEWVINPVYEGPTAHELTISDFLEVSMFETVDGKIRTNIVTISGSFSINIESLYRWNYAPFVLGGQAMVDVKIGYSCSDIRSPLWMFGDSYLGIAVNRIGGQLRNFGFTSYLMDSIAGGRAVDSGNPGKSVSEDLTKLLEIATPKYIIWTLGMNGTIQMNIDYIAELKTLCEEKNIMLILYTVPSIPNNDKTQLNSYITSTGLRYINAYDAVGANAAGAWYSGFLSSDNVHPSTIGAKAIAMRFLADVPELMQYGYSTGNVESESDDDDET